MSVTPASSQAATTIARSVWALLMGILFIMIGNGLQSTLLAIRAVDEGFSATITGIMTACYFGGMFLASFLVPAAVERVGHVRVFAALASLASTAILIQSVFVDPIVWSVMRTLTGLSFAGLYIVCESWLNEEATSENRGQILSIYMIVMMMGASIGQVLVNTSDPAKVDLFILVSILISLSLVPLALSRIIQPATPASERIKLKEIYDISPFGTVGAFVAGMGMAIVMGMGAVYGKVIGMSNGQIALFAGAIILGPVVMQWPIGRLSDLFDRRRVIVFVCLLAGAMAIVCDVLLPTTGLTSLLGALVVGGASISLYSLFLAYLMDFVDRSKIVGLCGMYVAISGSGSILSPLLVGYALDMLGGGGFWGVIAVLHLGLGVYGFYRMTMRSPTPSEEQATFTVVASATLPLATEWSEEVYDFASEEETDDNKAPDHWMF